MPEPMAVFSECRTYRYTLRRRLDERERADELFGTPWPPRFIAPPAPRRICWLMLNPSTADETHNDPTVAKCIRLSRRWGYGSLVVVNLFALRSTDPKALYHHKDPIGPGNDEHIVREAEAADQVICAWGQHGALCGTQPDGVYNRRSVHVRRLLESAGVTIHALRVTTGEPHHPLYLPESLTPFPLTRNTNTQEGTP